MVMEDRYAALSEIIRQYFIKYPCGKAGLQALLNKRNYDDRGGGRTALHYACSAKTVQLCVKHGADVDARDAFGLTPMHIYILENRLCCVKAILALNASINIRAAKNKRCGMRKGRKTPTSRDKPLNGSMGLYNRSSVMLAAQCANYDALLILLCYSPRKVLSSALASIGISDRESSLDVDTEKEGDGVKEANLGEERSGSLDSSSSRSTSTSSSQSREGEAALPLPEHLLSPTKSPPFLDPREHTDSEGNTCLHLVCAATSHTLSNTDRLRILLPERNPDPIGRSSNSGNRRGNEEDAPLPLPRLQSIVR